MGKSFAVVCDGIIWSQQVWKITLKSHAHKLTTYTIVFSFLKWNLKALKKNHEIAIFLNYQQPQNW